MLPPRRRRSAAPAPDLREYHVLMVRSATGFGMMVVAALMPAAAARRRHGAGKAWRCSALRGAQPHMAYAGGGGAASGCDAAQSPQVTFHLLQKHEESAKSKRVPAKKL